MKWLDKVVFMGAQKCSQTFGVKTRRRGTTCKNLILPRG